MLKSDPEYKNFKESYDRVLSYFTDRFQFLPDDVTFEVFTEINNRQTEIINVLSKSMLDICDLVRFFSKCFKKANPVKNVGTSSTQS